MTCGRFVGQMRDKKGRLWDGCPTKKPLTHKGLSGVVGLWDIFRVHTPPIGKDPHLYNPCFGGCPRA